MARIFITGSTDGLGKLAAQSLIGQGHGVVLHARNKQRAEDIKQAVPHAEATVIGDLASNKQTKLLAADVNALGRFDAVIHNAGITGAAGQKLLAVNTLAPYILTCLIRKPSRLIYLSSSMHKQGNPSPERIKARSNNISYSDSKLYVLMLTKAVARKWPEVCANAVDPGWVPTRMGGSSATDDLDKGYETQVWLAVSNQEEAKVSGHYLYHQSNANYHTEADNTKLQEKLLAACEKITGVTLKA